MKLLSEALGEALALVGKATPGPWRWWTSCSFNRLSSDATGKDGDVLRGVRYKDGVCGVEGKDADMEALVASINFLRQHGPAIAAVLRAVEGDALDAARYRWLRRALLGAEDDPIDQLLLEKEPETDAEFDAAVDAAIDKARGVPLDAAGSAEGVG